MYKKTVNVLLDVMHILIILELCILRVCNLLYFSLVH